MPGVDLHDQVLSALGRSIVVGDLRPGHVLRTEQLEAQYGVSRSVMREVVRVLVAMNLVTSRRSIGVTVRASSRWNPFDPEIVRWRLSGPDRVQQLRSLGELRTGIEPTAALLAASRALPEHHELLTTAVAGMSVTARAADLDGFLRHDVAFHRTLLLASGNEMFAGLAGMVEEVLLGRAEHHLMPEPPERPAVELHMAVAAAVRSGEGPLARKAMESLLDDTRRGLQVVLQQSESPSPAPAAAP